MGMFMKKPSHRVFDYPPRFYKPEADEIEKKKKKLGFTRKIKSHRRKQRSPLIWIILAIIVVFIYLKLAGLG